MRTRVFTNSALVARIESILGNSISGSDYSLERVASAAKAMGLDQVICPLITIAGTNGKGSVAKVVEVLLNQDRFKVGVYASPHLSCLTERVRIGGVQSKVKDWDDFIERFGDILKKYSLTFYEATTLAAYYQMQHENCDIIILEVGMGGELDAVNIWDADYVALTNISLDHTEILGETCEAILETKMKVIKGGAQVICGDLVEREALQEYSRALPADLHFLGEDFSYSVEGEEFIFSYNNVEVTFPCPNLHPASVAIGCRLAANFIDIESISDFVLSNLELFQLPGRWEIVNQYPLTVIDVAHNPAAIQGVLQRLRAEGYDPIWLLAVLSRKDYNTIVKLIADYGDYPMVVVEALEKGGVGGSEIINVIGKYKDSVPHLALDVQEGIDKCRHLFEKIFIDKIGRKPIIVAVGSFELIAQVRDIHKT